MINVILTVVVWLLGAMALVVLTGLLVYSGLILVSASTRDPLAWRAMQIERQAQDAARETERRDRAFLRRIRRINRSIDRADVRRRKKIGLAYPGARVVNRRRAP